MAKPSLELATLLLSQLPESGIIDMCGPDSILEHFHHPQLLLYNPFLPLLPSSLSPHLSPRQIRFLSVSDLFILNLLCKMDCTIYCVAFFTLHNVFKIYQGSGI